MQRKYLRLKVSRLLFSALVGLLASSGLRAAAEDTPASKAATATPNGDHTIDSTESALLESALSRPPYATGIAGIWPQREALRKAKPYNLGSHFTGQNSEWFGRVLKKSVQPENEQWNSKEWLIVPRLRWQSDWIVGHFTSQDPRVARIEFQQGSSSNLTITIISPELFPNRKFDAKEIRGKLGDLLNIPADCLPHLEVHLNHLTVGDDPILVTYAKVFDARYRDPLATEPADPPAIRESEPRRPPPTPSSEPGLKQLEYRALIPEDKREWFSPMSVCIFKGRLSIHFSTIDWKGDDRPMKAGFDFK